MINGAKGFIYSRPPSSKRRKGEQLTLSIGHKSNFLLHFPFKGRETVSPLPFLGSIRFVALIIKRANFKIFVTFLPKHGTDVKQVKSFRFRIDVELNNWLASYRCYSS